MRRTGYGLYGYNEYEKKKTVRKWVIYIKLFKSTQHARSGKERANSTSAGQGKYANTFFCIFCTFWPINFWCKDIFCNMMHVFLHFCIVFFPVFGNTGMSLTLCAIVSCDGREAIVEQIVGRWLVISFSSIPKGKIDRFRHEAAEVCHGHPQFLESATNTLLPLYRIHI